MPTNSVMTRITRALVMLGTLLLQASPSESQVPLAGAHAVEVWDAGTGKREIALDENLMGRNWRQRETAD